MGIGIRTSCEKLGLDSQATLILVGRGTPSHGDMCKSDLLVWAAMGSTAGLCALGQASEYKYNGGPPTGGGVSVGGKVQPLTFPPDLYTRMLCGSGVLQVGGLYLYDNPGPALKPVLKAHL